MHFHYILFVFSFGLVTHARDTEFKESKDLFANLCFNPKPAEDFDIEWISKMEQPAGGWYAEYANDVAALHASEVLKGQLLTNEENYDDMCWRVKVEHGDKIKGHIDGEYFGFGKSYANFTCDASKDFRGVLYCDINHPGKYKEPAHVYRTYVPGLTNFHITILCYPTGEVGWHTTGLAPQLTEDEKIGALNYLYSFGFPKDTHVVTFTEKCKQ